MGSDITTPEVTIGGEPRRIGDFSAFKSAKAMEVITEVSDTFEKVLAKSAEFKREYEATNYVEMDRAEARRNFRPRPLYRTIPVERDGELVLGEDGEVVFREEPVLTEDGDPVLGPDPLAHLTEDDWEGSGQKLRVPDSPSRSVQVAAVAPMAFTQGREHLLKLLALVLVPNDDLERWDLDGEVDVDAKLTEQAGALLHRAKLPELVTLGVATWDHLEEELSDPFGQLETRIGRLRSRKQPATQEPEPMAMEVEAESTETSPTSPTPSPAGTDGDGSSAGTASPSASLSS